MAGKRLRKQRCVELQAQLKRGRLHAGGLGALGLGMKLSFQRDPL